VFFRNAHGHEVKLQPGRLTWRTIGGSIDLYFYAGPTAATVTQSYQRSTIGLPAMQQYFTLGYHQSRWGYRNWTELQEVVTKVQYPAGNYLVRKLPLQYFRSFPAIQLIAFIPQDRH
jgi:alpha-glucosidase